jgi:hypothetical protein
MDAVFMRRLRGFALAAGFVLGLVASGGAWAQTVTATLPEVNFEFDGPYPSALQDAGSFSYAPPGTVTSATISGTFGNSQSQSSAPTRVFLNGVLVAQCGEDASCTESPQAWSFAIPSSMFGDLQAGTADLTFIQDDTFEVRLGSLTLTLNEVALAPVDVPGLQPRWLAALIGLMAIAGLIAVWRRRT